jgi:hypothetical protein
MRGIYTYMGRFKAGSREQGAGSTEHRAGRGSREQGAGSMEHRAQSTEHGAGSTGHRAQGTGSGERDSENDSAFIEGDCSCGVLRSQRIMRNKNNGTSVLMIIFNKRHENRTV